jgi:hypothetical protein
VIERQTLDTSRVATLMACPFCRELYTEGELDVCPACDVVLRPLADLPPSFEALEQQAAEWEQTAPADRTFAWHYAGRGRALLLLTSTTGLVLFFCPWISMTLPDLLTLSGFQLATSRGFWFAGGAVGYFISIPLIISRRTLVQMQGARVILTLFTATTFFQTLLLFLNPPARELIPVQFTWAWGFFASALLSLVSIPIALRFGGRHDDVPQDFALRTRRGVLSEARFRTPAGSTDPLLVDPASGTPEPGTDTPEAADTSAPRVLH